MELYVFKVFLTTTVRGFANTTSCLPRDLLYKTLYMLILHNIRTSYIRDDNLGSKAFVKKKLKFG